MKKQINNYRSYLSEVTRKDIVGKSKQQSKPRYSKSSDYKPALRPSDINIDIKTLLRSGQLVIQILQQGEKDYICTIAYDGFLDELKKAVGMQEKPYVNLNTIITVMRKSIDNSDVYVDCTCPDFCLEENTEIKLLNGEIHTVKEILDMFNNGEELWVYSTDANGDFKPGKVTDVWVSGYVNEMVKVTLDNGKTIITTPNHRYMMRDGTYVEAKDLQKNDSLMPLYFKYQNGYENVKLNTKPKSWVSVYKTVANTVLTDEIKNAEDRTGEDIISIHHSDFNKLNNYPSNLKPMGRLEQWQYHANHILENTEQFEKFRLMGLEYWKTPEGRAQKSQEMSQTMRKFWDSMTEEEKADYISKSHQWQNDEEYRQKMSKVMTDYWANLDEETYNKRCQKNNINLNGVNGELSAKRKKEWWANATPEQREHCKQAYLKTMEGRPVVTSEKKRKASSENLRKIATMNHIKDAERVIKAVIDNNLIVNEENYNAFRQKGDPKFETAVRYGLLENYNHKVVSVEYVTYEEAIPVYDLTVDDYNNFYVDAGVVLHNCYRFAYWATKYGYKYGYKQNTPPKYNKTNMYDNNGAVCKHLLGTIREKDKLVVKASTVLNNAIKKYPNDFRKALGMNTDDFIVNNRAGRRINTRNTIADDSSDIDNMEDAFWATH